MSMTDPVADLLSRIRTAHVAKHDRLDLPASKLKTEICGLLKEQGYISSFEILDEDPVKQEIRIFLKYTDNGEPMIRHMRRISKPGRRVYVGRDQIPVVLGGLGVSVLSTSRGLMTGKRARTDGVGGEVLFEIY